MHYIFHYTLEASRKITFFDLKNCTGDRDYHTINTNDLKKDKLHFPSGCSCSPRNFLPIMSFTRPPGDTGELEHVNVGELTGLYFTVNIIILGVCFSSCV